MIGLLGRMKYLKIKLGKSRMRKVGGDIVLRGFANKILVLVACNFCLWRLAIIRQIRFKLMVLAFFLLLVGSEEN